ncbi:putative methyltransferase [Nocardia brasiliensis NBRC 14402]|uniref:O-methyltransferase n=1 Tax=Nocardia brasiliensis TaxID=37326 RepID=UPI0002DF3E29|nr:class I SAM-dependent methyltransferase [Nocardia brasiliensis]ASF08183.1 methyltransferase [Nocardia brasiliensis]GAJ83828.1 putative methyltransferase [Nocardia brasiliensis NBRC 14402]SUB54138.1 Predicted O-methyltransferase [Nocardia brasiliensis]
MTNTLQSESVLTVLDRLFAAAAVEDEDPSRWPAGRSYADASAQERADVLEEVLMPISAHGGTLLYTLVRAARPATIVEFGTSFGISTIYLAAAVTDNGVGHVLSTELSQSKVVAAQANLAEAGVADAVTILPGDALITLAEVPGPIGLVLLDGWKDLCLPVLRLLEDRLAPGAVVVADDTTMASMGDYLNHVRDPANGYVSVDYPVADGMEISCRTGQTHSGR